MTRKHFYSLKVTMPTMAAKEKDAQDNEKNDCSSDPRAQPENLTWGLSST
jgi:hypothetical protein